MSLRPLLACATIALLAGLVQPAPAQLVATPRPPLMETIRGESPIQLRGLRIEAQVRGGLAQTTVRMLFFNPNARPLEGNLSFPLLDGQSVTGFALDIDGRLRAAVPVPKSKGQQTFEAIERTRIDPALLEKTQGNNFRLRVFPIPAKGTRTVELRYTEALSRLGAERQYRLPLDFGADIQDFELLLETDAAGKPRANQVLGQLDFVRSGEVYRATVARHQFRPDGRLELLLPTPAQAQVSVQARDADLYFVAEIPVPAERVSRPLPKVVGLLWDSSTSGARRELRAELRELDDYFGAIGNGEVRLLRLRDRTEPLRSFAIRNGDWSALRKELESTVYDGASALADWTPQADVGEYLLVSDGLLNYGPLAFPSLRSGQRLYALSSAGSADNDRLRAVAEASGGQLLQVSARSPGAAARRMLSDGVRVEALEGDGLADLVREPGDAGDGFLRVAGRLLRPDASLRLRLAGAGNARTTSVSVSDRAAPNPFAAMLWANYRLAALEARPELQRAEIARIGTSFGIPTSETSLIVLDRVEDYVGYSITPPPELAEAYAALKGESDRKRASTRSEHFEQVVAEFQRKQEWWTTEFPKGTPPVPKKDSLHEGQSGSTGSIAGQTTARATVVVENPATGFRREVTADTDGYYRIGNLPAGTYQVTSGGQTRNAVVTIGSSAQGTSLGTVSVQGGQSLEAVDSDSAESTTLLRSEQIAAVPVPRDITSVALLAPGTVRAAAPAPASETAVSRPQASIAMKRWESDAPYMARLKSARTEDLYAIYLDERPGYANSTGFFLDVSDVLRERGQAMLAMRVLSNLAEMELDSRHILRVLGYRLLQAGAPELAVPVFEKVLALADYEPQSFRDLGNAYAAAGDEQRAVDTLYEVVSRPWDERFSEVELIALAELNAIAAHAGKRVDTGRLDARLLRNLPLDLRVVLTWDADNSDMDLWVTDPNQEKCFYQHQSTYQGGRLSQDFTGGYGPEEFSLRTAKKGKYKVEVNYFGDRQQTVAGPTTLQLRFTTGFGTSAAKEQLVNLRLKDSKETSLVGEFVVD